MCVCVNIELPVGLRPVIAVVTREPVRKAGYICVYGVGNYSCVCVCVCVCGLTQRCRGHMKGTGHVLVLECVGTYCICAHACVCVCVYFYVFVCVYVAVSFLPGDICF